MTSTTSAVAVLCCLAASCASASTVTQNQFIPTTMSFPKVDFSGFDSSLGTLTDVSVTVTGTATLAAGGMGGTTQELFDGSANMFRGLYDGFFDADFGGGLELSAWLSGPSFSCSTSVAGDLCNADYASASQPLNAVDSASDLAHFTDTPVSVYPDVSSNRFIRDGTWSYSSTYWTAAMNLELVYTYTPTPVPVPAALPLSLAGVAIFAGLGLRRKNRR